MQYSRELKHILTTNLPIVRYGRLVLNESHTLTEEVKPHFLMGDRRQLKHYSVAK